ncbi:MAG: Ig-like domain-containing protein, partial [Trichodesmium sp. St18_bin1]|nr:Ig-like domain-containing protein [Trichodesmium sp. St18_bin1]
NGDITFIPDSNYNGPISFDYVVQDGNGGEDTGKVTGTVAPVNDPPVADDESFTMDEDGAPVTLDLLTGDTDPDNDTLSIKSIKDTELTPGTAQTITVPNGTVNVAVNGDITFIPDSNYNGPISFDYVVQDGNGGEDTGTVTGTVTPVNDPPVGDNELPVALNDTTSTNKGKAVTFSITDNDTDSDGTVEPATVDLDPSTPGTKETTKTVPGEGTYIVDNEGNITFTPVATFVGTTNPITYTVEDNDGGLSNPAEISVTVTINGQNYQKFDFNADGIADILWRHKNVANRIWFMNDDGTRKSVKNPGNYAKGWDVAGVGDFNTDGVADILWRDDNVANRIWLMNGDGTRDQIVKPGNYLAAWDVAGVGDFNADGVDDILWRDDNVANRIWLMNNDGTRKSIVNPGNYFAAWDVAGVGDFNTDGVADILWRNENGRNRIWLMNNDGTRDDIVNPGGLGLAWDVAGVADFNADEMADILWRNENGTNSIWLMNNDGTHDDIVNPGAFNSTWDVAQVADFNADGVADILWRHENIANRIWLMNNDGTRDSIVNPGSFGSTWDVVGM